MTHPNGELSFFNDSSLGVALSLDNIRKYSISLGFVNDSREKTFLQIIYFSLGKKADFQFEKIKIFISYLMLQI